MSFEQENIDWTITEDLVDSLDYQPPYKINHTYRMSVRGGDETFVGISERFGNLQVQLNFVPLDADGREGLKAVRQWYSSAWQPVHVQLNVDTKKRDMAELIGILRGRGIAEPGKEKEIHNKNVRILADIFQSKDVDKFVGPCGYADYIQFRSASTGKLITKFQNFRADAGSKFPLVDSF